MTPEEIRQGCVVLFLVLLMALIETAGVASVFPFLAVLSNPEIVESHTILSGLFSLGAKYGLFHNHDDFLIFLGCFSFLLIVLSAGLKLVTNLLINNFIEMRRHSLSCRLMDIYLDLPYLHFIARHSADLSKTMLSEVDQFIGNFLRPIFNMIAYSCVAFLILLLLIAMNPFLAFCVFGVMGGMYLLVYLTVKEMLGSLGALMVEANRYRFTQAAEAFSSYKELKILGLESFFKELFQKNSYVFSKVVSKHLTVNQVPKYIVEAFAFGGVIGLVIVLLYLHGGLGGDALGQILPMVGLYAFAAYRLQPALQAVFSGFASCSYGEKMISNLCRDMEFRVQIDTVDKTMFMPATFEKKLVFDRVSFSYEPGKMQNVVNDVCFELYPGEVVGVVGGSGSGKTTLIDLALGLLDPTEGSIRVDGLTVNTANVRGWQCQIGYVPQEIYISDVSLAENIAFGCSTGNIDMNRVRECAEVAQIDEYVMNLPEQYDTQTGECGVFLSGGQRQRIGIARALYRAPSLLVMDEATSALDTKTELRVIEAVHRYMRDKAIVIVTHRSSTLKYCRKILTVENGQVKVAESLTNPNL